METKHTPVPWRVMLDYDNVFRETIPGRHTIKGDDDYNVARVWERNTEGLAKANAEFIARACNAYDDLLKALESIATLASCAPNDDEEAADKELTKIMNLAQLAIKRAQESANV